MKKNIEQYLNMLTAFVTAPKFRFVVSISVYVVLPMVLLSAVLFVHSDRTIAIKAGKVAQILLLIILFMKPVGMIIRNDLLRKALIYRQAMGVAMMYFALFHAYFTLDRARIFDLMYYVPTSNILYGVLALTITLALGITSNRFAMRQLRHNWKRLHRLAYPLLFLMFLHVSLATGEKKMVVLAVTFIILKVMEKKKIHITIPIISRTNA